MALLYRMGTGNGSGGDLKPYTVNFECANGYIGQTLTMTYQGTPHAGETVDNVSGTVASDGTLTLYPMHSGNWECSCYSSVIGTTMTKTIDLSYWGVQPTVAFEDKPDGATATPTDDVQTWLHCADIFDKQYTTVSQVVADKTTLNALVQNENANDYLVRSTTFSTTLCENNANNEAMYYLGLYDGCANKLLADDYWRDAICNADVLLADGQTHLFEKVLNVKVPRMTANNAPYGEAISGYNANHSLPYMAFDNNDTTRHIGTEGADSSSWLGYKFTNPICVKKISYHITNATFKIQGSNDGSTWEDIENGKTHTDGTKMENIANDKYYLQYRILKTVSTPGMGMTTNELQFYGREEA